jgi:hypothetical protein
MTYANRGMVRVQSGGSACRVNHCQDFNGVSAGMNMPVSCMDHDPHGLELYGDEDTSSEYLMDAGNDCPVSAAVLCLDS